jgi:hypothetical protein
VVQVDIAAQGVRTLHRAVEDAHWACGERVRAMRLFLFTLSAREDMRLYACTPQLRQVLAVVLYRSACVVRTRVCAKAPCAAFGN